MRPVDHLSASHPSPVHPPRDQAAAPTERNRVLKGTSNGVFAVVNNVPLSLHIQRVPLEVVGRKISREEIPRELARLAELEKFFAPEKDEGPFAFIVRDVFGSVESVSKINARKLIETDLVNVEAAVDRAITAKIKGRKEIDGEKGLEAAIADAEAEKKKFAAEIARNSNRLQHTSDASVRREILAKNNKLDESSEGTRSLLVRFQATLGDLRNLLGRALIRLASTREETYSAGTVHAANCLSWPEIKALSAAGVPGFIFDSAEMGPIGHPFIFAHENGIPVVTIRNALDRVGNSSHVSIDSRTGEVIIDPTPTTVDELKRRAAGYKELVKLLKLNEGVSRTLDDRPIPRLQLNIKDREDHQKVQGRDVGLYRTEGLYTESRPMVSTLVRTFKGIIAVTNLATIRLFDIDVDKVPEFFTEENRAAFVKTWGGIDFLLNNDIGRSILDDQVRALLVAVGRRAEEGTLTGKTIRLTLPMVTGPHEIRVVKEMIRGIEKDLLARKIISEEVHDHIQVGAMIETSAAILNVEDLADEAAYFSIGGNDLTKEILGLHDRKQMMTAKEFDWLSPRVLKAVRRTIEVAKQKKIPVGFCGEMARDPMGAILLTLMEIDSLSMDEPYVKEISFLLKKMHMGEWEKFAASDPGHLSVVDRALKLDDALQVREYLYDLIFNKAHADTRLSLAHIITSARPLTYQAEEK